MSASSRTALLLGAGASADAGLPLTSDLAAYIVEVANDNLGRPDERPVWVRAINAAYSSMVGFRGSLGGNPLDAVNIETLISAVRLLQRRDEHEVAPFVAAWSAALNDFGSTNDFGRLGESLQDAMLAGVVGRGSGDTGRIAETVAHIARAAVRPDPRVPFEDAERFILRTLTERLGNLGAVDYLFPIVDLALEQEGGLDVITLNYDLTMETAARRRGVDVNRGVDSWRPGSPMDFEARDKVINLLKLHGSLDWRLIPQRLPSDSYEIEVGASFRGATLPWIVVGDREKLATEGPTLELNFAARRVMDRADHLVVVGYSFGDAHINAVVRDWMNHDEGRTITILEYRWPRLRYGDAREFRESLLRKYGRRGPVSAERPIRLAAVEGPAESRLAYALKAQPHLAPKSLFDIRALRGSKGVVLDITLAELDLDDVTIELRDVSEVQEQRGIGRSVELAPRPPWAHHDDVSRLFNRFHFPRWPSGISVTLLGTTQSSTLTLTIEGFAPVGFQHVQVTISLPAE